MEAKVGGSVEHQLHCAKTSNGLKKKNFDWDLNDWKWDGSLFTATPLNSAPSDCRNKQLFCVQEAAMQANRSTFGPNEIDFGLTQKGNGKLEGKRRRIIVVEEEEEDDESYDQFGSPSLKLGEQSHLVSEAGPAPLEENNEKSAKLQGRNSSGPSCQVAGCGGDLTEARDYLRRHKVCEVHYKAKSALVGNDMKRFCQQCSRFHLLQEFDGDKRSCRRRLAGHNERRRKTPANPTPNGTSFDGDQNSSYILLSLLKILSNLESVNSEQPNNQELLIHLLTNLAGLAGSSDSRNIARLLQASQENLHKSGSSAGQSSEAANALPNSYTLLEPNTTVATTAAASAMPLERTKAGAPVVEKEPGIPSQRTEEAPLQLNRLKNFDLNCTYNDQEHCLEQHTATTATQQNGSLAYATWMVKQSGPSQMNGNLDSSSWRSLNSNRNDQSRTDKIVFKLFGKDPKDFPLVLHPQISNWLLHCPTEMESYIRPGCIILTLYLRLADSLWEELYHDLTSWMERLLNISSDDFWRTGWVIARVQHHMAFIYNGMVLLEAPLPSETHNSCKILSVTPIAVPCSSTVNFTVKGLSLAQSTSRLLCAFDGKYLFEETTQALCNGTNELPECLSFSCSIPDATGRGFIEVEDYDYSSIIFPFIVAEDNICSEIRALENEINVASYDKLFEEGMGSINTQHEAVKFLHEMGWLLRRSHMQSKSQQIEFHTEVFTPTRFRWLVSFAVNREWCAVVKKLLDVMFHGSIDLDDQTPSEFALGEDLLHTAVRKKSKPLVELLLRYRTEAALKEKTPPGFLFRPDMMGPSNITPLHVAATISEAEGVLDALTNDPQQLGVKAWKNCRDITGFTPEDYARSRGHESYIQLVQKKIDIQMGKNHIFLGIPSTFVTDASYRKADGSNYSKQSAFQIDKFKFQPMQQPYCKQCEQQVFYRPYARRSLLYRPVVFAMTGIAAVCVCVALIMKGPPVVRFIDAPFTWESLGSGYM
ncbi:squamosa promoter-binding-like protein 1 [Ananas comosus]|uniref:Squamosa promoter-binding-like protein 1 n=1 Tax=Ananas comosus TaxID=4615 RepID=A0A6P5EVB5_ANACO|nr:squamosa promoter-binding-like protein 1 [Ananas comosus]